MLLGNRLRSLPHFAAGPAGVYGRRFVALLGSLIQELDIAPATLLHSDDLFDDHRKAPTHIVAPWSAPCGAGILCQEVTLCLGTASALRIRQDSWSLGWGGEDSPFGPLHDHPENIVDCEVTVGVTQVDHNFRRIAR